jgi:hypothetical protein
MKYLKSIALIFCLVLGFSFLISCGNSAPKEQKVEKTGIEYESKYVCPMHCKGSGSENAGTCAVCGMDYVLNEEHKKDNHSH